MVVDASMRVTVRAPVDCPNLEYNCIKKCLLQCRQPLADPRVCDCLPFNKQSASLTYDHPLMEGNLPEASRVERFDNACVKQSFR